MNRALLLVLVLLPGCQRPVAAVLTYAPVSAAESEDAGPVDMDRTLLVVQQRLRAARLPCRASLDTFRDVRIEVFADDQETLDQIDRIVTALGTFELRVVANAIDHKDLIERAQETAEREVRDDDGRILGWWMPIEERASSKIVEYSEATTRKIDRDGISDLEMLVVNDPYQVDGTLLVRAAPGIDQSGRPNVTFQLSKKGGEMMAGLTSENLPDEVSGHTRKLAIILNGRVFSAPRIQSTIREYGEISGDFTEQEVADLASVLSSGRCPTPLERVSIERVGGSAE